MKSASVVCAAALFVASGSGCFLFEDSASRLKNGESYTSGQEKYDAFFASVSDVRGRAEKAEAEAELRKKVAEAVGLPASAKLEDTIDAAKTKSNELKKDGGRFFVVVAAEPKLIVKKGTEENKEAATFAQTIEDAIKEGIKRGDELDALAREAAGLEETLVGLEKEFETTTFSDDTTKDQVKLELDASKELLEKARLRAGSESGQALRFVVLLASAVDSGAAAELLAMEAGMTKEKPKPKPFRGGGRPGKPVKPKPKNDFDP
jgi:hypothetical protein